MMSHMGKPKGKVNEKLSLSQIVPNVSAALGVEVKFAKDCGNASEEAAALKPGEALLLENLRFYPEEEKNDPEFAKKLASLADIFVSDAFGTVHRAHASTAGVAAYLPAVAALQSVSYPIATTVPIVLVKSFFPKNSPKSTRQALLFVCTLAIP